MPTLTSPLVTLAAEAGHSELPIHPYLIGAITLAVLLALVIALVAFGGGREHS
ncbi:hypothetical protein [Nocardioides perillae]|uniref:Uncharacterized protein n=1 Tax=Nocardioides perillae TaxID=1119534 RepID=A0A7Y9RWN3_9ACTN|nr:hypothetical protein [Nocardioides perillae]NYG55494.1 hypothetical protein [Nocardioides perillae]